MQNYTVSAYDSLDFICMDGHLWDDGYVMCVHQYHYMTVIENMNSPDDENLVSYNQ